MKLWMLGAYALLGLWVFGSSPLQAQMVTVNPVDTPGALSNPLMGFRPDLDNWNQNPAYPTVVRHYIRWNEIENHESDTVQKIRDFCNSKWANLPAANIKVIPRVYLDWNDQAGNEYWPADLQASDWASQQFKDRVVRLIDRLGEVWDNDPRVAWVQTGIIGYWGEQENPVGVNQDGWGQRLGNAFTSAFQNKKLIVRNMDHWPGYQVGVYWDSFGHPSQRGQWNTILGYMVQGRHLNQVVEGEVAYDWGGDAFDPLYGGEPNLTLDNAQYTDNMIDVIRELHCSALGWIASYSLDGKHGTNPDNVRANAARMQREFGYRFQINEFSCSARTEPGDTMDVRFKVSNNGSAPFYENWPVAVVLVNQTTRQIAWKATIPNVDVRTWQPASNYSNSTRTYQTPAREHEFSASVPLPASLATGQYLVGLTILEPLSRTPGVFFSLPNFFKQSQTQPLCRIGVGVNVASHTLDGILFDDLVNDESRFYSITQQGANHSLTLLPSSLGAISQPSTNGTYLNDTGVEVKAIGKLGYGFSSWGGALAGSTENPAIVVMDASKTISANYMPVPVYRLSTDSTNGAVSLAPPGGIYNVGSEVTVTANPSSGYILGSWSGDLEGSASSMTVTITGDMSVTANFIVEPINGPVGFMVNCGGPAYADGGGLLLEADGIRSSGGSTFTPASPSSISGTTNDLLYQSERFGNPFGYNIPLANGDYEVTLMFAEINFNTVGSRVFNVDMEGSRVIAGLDILSKVPKNTAYNETHFATVSDGTLNIAFSAVTNNAKISAIKVERKKRPDSFALVTSAANGLVSLEPPGGVYDAGTVVTVSATPSSGYVFRSWSGDLTGSSGQTTITMDGNRSISASFAAVSAAPPDFQVNCGGPAYTAGDGGVFTADGTYNSGGGTYSSSSPVTNTPDGTLYQTERFGGSFSYNLPLENGEYQVTLMFAEIFFGAAGNRVFDVSMEGSLVIDNLDIWAEVGKNVAYNESHLIAVNDGQLNILFNSSVDNAKISAIKVTRLQSLPLVTLQTNASNGSITLNPPGGVYSMGTKVTMTGTADSGYKFFSWGGSHSGSVNPTVITMDANASVTANFIVAPSYPQAFTYNGNPLVRSHGAADPDVHVWDGTVWMYCSQDHAPDPGGAAYDRMDGYHAFSSTNMIDWVDHGEVLHSRNVNWGVDGFMWAPGAARANGQYYLYYPHKDTSGTWRIGVATSPVPQGPFTDIGAPLAGITGIDPAIFIDDDGQAYIYNNNFIVAKLKPNMVELAEPTRSIAYGPPEVTFDMDRQFNEGSYMHKRNGIYYYSYSNFKNTTHQSFYATGTSPYGPFEWKGPIAPKPTGAQDHHSMIEFQNQWYYFYHVAVPKYPALKDGQSRIVCYDKLFHNPDGTIQMVNLTMGQVGGADSASINCGGPEYMTDGGHGFEADGEYETGGNTATSTSPIFGTTSGPLYQSYRFGNSFAYNIPLENGDYKVTLMFAEVFFEADNSRVFDVSLEGNPVIVNLDVHSKVGKNAAYNEMHVVTIEGGQLNITLSASINNAMISAIKVERVGYTLLTGATDGSITLDPPGGNYNPGTVITVTGIPEAGYAFDSWGGNLSGNSNPTTITMNGNKSVTANFAAIPTYTLTTAATNGSISLTPPGGVYDEGTEVTVTARSDSNYTFASWNGDLAGSVNPTTITMNGDKSVTGGFVLIWSKPPVLQEGHLRLEWAGGGTLQTSLDLKGPWVDITQAVSPYRHPVIHPAQFFRVKK